MKTVLLAVLIAACALGMPADAADAPMLSSPYMMLMASPEGGTVSELRLEPTSGNLAGGAGLFQEGFGVGSYYVPNRRLNEEVKVSKIPGGNLLFYAYDCDGPNIRGFHVTRSIEVPDDASIASVHWTVENRGKEPQWLAPWVKNDLAPGGSYESTDRIDLPTLEGVGRVTSYAYHGAARNWFAATDPTDRTSVCGIFDANQLLCFAADARPDSPYASVQAVFAPQMLPPGGRWETHYRLVVFRGLERVDFATAELAAQIDYAPGKLQVLIASSRKIDNAYFHGRVRTPDGNLWSLADKRFTVQPGRLARCTYDWTAPADGSYEFLAQLLDKETPIELGEGLNPPHGGIDTQFTVGTADPAPLAAWTDAPHALDRGPRDLDRPLAASGDVAIWIEDPLEKISPADRVRPTGKLNATATLQLAANESESFQVVLRPPDGADVGNVTVRAHDLKDSASDNRIAASNVSVYRVAYVPVIVPSHFENPTGPVPDPLPAFRPFTARGGQSSPVWFTVHAPSGASAGNYSGMVEITGTGMEPVELWIEAEVLPFELPATPTLKTDFVYWPDIAFEQCRRRGYVGTQEELDADYLSNALNHRVTLRELTQLPSETANYDATLAQYRTRLQVLRQEGATTFAVPPSLLDLPELLTQAGAFVTQEALTERAFCPFATDPPRPAWPRTLENMQRWHDTAPEIALMATAKGMEPFLPDNADIWAVHTPLFDTPHSERLLTRIREGGEVWAYVNHAPPRPYANFFLDFSAVEHRVLVWQLWALGLKGLHYWGINYTEPGQDPWESQLDVTPANGNGLLVYPSADGPVTSIRWETLRDAIEDYDYFQMLRERALALRSRGGHERLLSEATAALDPKPLVVSLTAFTRDPAAIQQRRKEMGRLIVEIDEVLSVGRSQLSALQ
jgi:hypothetical protein